MEISGTTSVGWSDDPYGHPAHVFRTQDLTQQLAVALCGQAVEPIRRRSGRVIGETEGLCAGCCEVIDRISRRQHWA